MADEKKKKELEDSKRLADPKGGRTDDAANADTPPPTPPEGGVLEGGKGKSGQGGEGGNG